MFCICECIDVVAHSPIDADLSLLYLYLYFVFLCVGALLYLCLHFVFVFVYAVARSPIDAVQKANLSNGAGNGDHKMHFAMIIIC